MTKLNKNFYTKLKIELEHDIKWLRNFEKKEGKSEQLTIKIWNLEYQLSVVKKKLKDFEPKQLFIV